jgi:hypothetical protein
MSILYVFAIVFFEATAWARGTPNTMALVDEGTFGLFEDANRIYVDYQKQIFVADAHTNQVSMFTQPQESPKVIGGYGWSQTSFDTPAGIVADGVNVYISDKGNRRIQRYDRSLNFISSWSLVGNPDNAKNCGYPLGIVLTSSGEFFVLDGENNRIVKYAPDGTFDRSFGDIEAAEGKLQNPLTCSISESQQIYVLEPERILVYDVYGNFIQEIGKGILNKACGFCLTKKEVWVVSPDEVYRFSLEGSESGAVPATNIISETPLQDLRDICVDGNRMYLLTTHTVHRIRINR